MSDNGVQCELVTCLDLQSDVLAVSRPSQTSANNIVPSVRRNPTRSNGLETCGNACIRNTILLKSDGKKD